MSVKLFSERLQSILIDYLHVTNLLFEKERESVVWIKILFITRHVVTLFTAFTWSFNYWHQYNYYSAWKGYAIGGRQSILTKEYFQISEFVASNMPTNSHGMINYFHISLSSIPPCNRTATLHSYNIYQIIT